MRENGRGPVGVGFGFGVCDRLRLKELLAKLQNGHQRFGSAVSTLRVQSITIGYFRVSI